MTSRRILVRDRMITELNTPLPSNVPLATKRRWLPGLPLTEARIALYFGKEGNTLPQQRHSRIAHRGLAIGVQCAVTVTDIEEADDTVEPLLVHVIDRLSDSTLNNLATDIEEVQTEWEVFKGDLFYVVATLFLQVNYQTARGDITSKA